MPDLNHRISHTAAPDPSDPAPAAFVAAEPARDRPRHPDPPPAARARPPRHSDRRACCRGVAEELQSSLGDEFPSFVKPMVRSHVTGCFWLGLPTKFCNDYMPKDTETVMLVDENGEEYPTVFISRRTGLSGGWKAFSLEHDLVDGDALIFQLVEPTTLKVYIVRANEQESD